MDSSIVLHNTILHQPPCMLRTCIMVEPSPLTYVSGYANRFQELLHFLHEGTEDRVEVVTAEVVAPDPPKDFLGFPIHYTAGMRLPSYPLMSLSTDWTWKAFRVIRNMKPDLIHVSSPGLMVFSAVFCSRIFQIPLLMSYHTHLPVYARTYVHRPLFRKLAEWLAWKLIRVIHSFADVTVVTSPQILDEFRQHGIPRCQLWQKGIDTTRFHPSFRSEEMRRRMTSAYQDDCFLMVYVGRLASEKRLKDLRDVLGQMPDNARLCFVGSGPQEQELRDYFDSFRERCVFTGQLLGAELSKAFASGDVFCMPSDSETLGFTVLESMASGVPVVGVRAGGVPDLIRHNETGFLVSPGDTNATVQHLLQIKENLDLRAEMSITGRIETERWSWESSMAKLRNESYACALENFQLRFAQQWSRRLKRIWTFRSKHTKEIL